MLEGLQKEIPSIQQIVNQKDRSLKQIQVQRLFQMRALPIFQTQEFRNSDLKNNYIFSSLTKCLEEWNSKVKNKAFIFNHRSQLYRNQFIFSSLKRLLVKSNNIDRQLQNLYMWYRKNSINPISFEPSLKKVQIDDQWEIRKTFKSNMPIQINNYRRRQFYQQQFKQNQIEPRKQIGSAPLKIRIRSKLHFYKYEQEQLRKQREQNQIEQAKSTWKVQKSRYQSQTLKNFYKQKFIGNSEWNDRKQVSARSDSFQNIKQSKLKRLLGIKYSQNKAQSFQLFPTAVQGLSLVSNPFQTKIKKKKKIERK